MDEQTNRLRALGYHLDLQGQWVHTALGLAVMDPVLLLEEDGAQVEAFHDPAVWADLREAPRPLMDAELSRRVRQLEMEWSGWLGVWSSPSGVQLTHRGLEDLGPDGLSQLEEGRLEWLAEHGRRRFAGCAGMALMISWLGVGWVIAGSVTVWLIGMALIAVGSWLTRPMPWPVALNPEGPDTEESLVEGRSMLGADWHHVALLTAPIPADSDHVHFLNLERTIAIDALLANFTPECFVRILHAVEPLDDDNEEFDPGGG